MDAGFPAGAAPAPWLTWHSSALPTSGTALDVASGRGRHAIWLASQGLGVTALDRDRAALIELKRGAEALGLSIDTRCVDLEAYNDVIEAAAFDVVVVVHYLHRPLFPELIAALRPGGLLIYETFTRAQAALGKPTNPAFLLEAGELRRLVQPLEILESREGFFEGKHVASVIAQNNRSPDL